MRIRRLILPLLLVATLCWPLSSQTEPTATSSAFSSPRSYYVWKGAALQVVNTDPATSSYAEWQVWLYSRPVDASKYGSGLAYVRWGVIHGASARSAIQQLDSYQQFERAYTSLSGENTWGRFTFLCPIGPIAIATQDEADYAHDLNSKIDFTNQGLQSVVFALRPSLVNGQGSDEAASVRQYFDEVRDSMQGVARFYDKLSRRPSQHSYLAQELALLTPHIDQAEGAVSKVTRILPSVKLPSNEDWMSYSELVGKEGTVTHTVREAGTSALVQETWAGGDGSMSGTNITTIVAYQDIGNLEVWSPSIANELRWTLHMSPRVKTASHKTSRVPNALPKSELIPRLT